MATLSIPQPLSLPRPHSGPTSVTSVTIQPLPLAAILDHHLRRPDHQDRVFGTLLGLRNTETGEIEVRSSFGVPYAATGRDVAVDSDHHRNLLDLHHRVSPKEVVVGWYATSPILNSFSSLIQDFYNSESSPFSAIHLTLDPVNLNFKTFISSPIGLSTLQSLNLLFKPVPSHLSIPTVERTALELLTKPLIDRTQKIEENQVIDLKRQQDQLIERLKRPIQTDLPMNHLKDLLIRLESMLEQVDDYVDKVNLGQIKGNPQLGRFLLDTIGSLPIGLTKNSTHQPKNQEAFIDFEENFQSHIADVLMVSYVANLLRDQVEISSRLNLLVSQ